MQILCEEVSLEEVAGCVKSHFKAQHSGCALTLSGVRSRCGLIDPLPTSNENLFLFSQMLMFSESYIETAVSTVHTWSSTASSSKWTSPSG